jgi:hypothetical protein
VRRHAAGTPAPNRQVRVSSNSSLVSKSLVTSFGGVRSAYGLPDEVVAQIADVVVAKLRIGFRLVEGRTAATATRRGPWCATPRRSRRDLLRSHRLHGDLVQGMIAC